MSVRAKFRVTSYTTSLGSQKREVDGVTSFEPVELRTIKFQPVYGNGDPEHENTKFWQASPSGSIELGTINPQAWEQFELNAEYYVDFTKAEIQAAPKV